MTASRVSFQSDARQIALHINKALRRTDALELSVLVDAVDDTAAALAGVPVDGFYRNGSVLMIRVA